MDMAKEKEEGKGRIEEKKDFLQILLEIKDQGDAATSISMNQLKSLLMVYMSNFLLSAPFITST